MTWKDGGNYGRLKREVVSESCSICQVWTRKYISDARNETETEPRPQGEANFNLILKAPQMLEALEAIHAKAERMLLSPYAPGGTHCPHEDWADWETVRGHARTAIVAAKGEACEKA